MLKKILLLIVTVVALSTEFVHAQDPEFTQFYANPLYLNPAFAGSVRCPRVTLNYRNQWPSIPQGGYITYSAGYDQFVDYLGGGVGFLATRDDAGQGIYTVSNYSAMYAYQLNVNRNFSIKFGTKATYTQRKLDWSRLNFGDMIDSRSGFIYNTAEVNRNASRGNLDISAGVLAFTKRYFGGFAVDHLTEPDEGMITKSILPKKYTAHFGAVIPLQGSDEASISPNVLYQKQQDFTQMNLGLYITKGPVVGGIWSRTGRTGADAFIVLLGFQQQLYKFGYSYDITVSKLGNNATAGSHELSFALQMDCKPKKKKFRTISCPSF